MPTTMRDTAKILNYPGGVDGTAALDWAVHRRELEHAGEERRPKTIQLQQTRIRPRRKPARLPLLTMLGAVIAAALAFQIIMNCIELTRLSSETVALNRVIETLQEENEVLQAEHDRTFDLATIKAAAEEMGMVKPSSGQVVYVDVRGQDSAVVFQRREVSLTARLCETLRGACRAVVEYFN